MIPLGILASSIRRASAALLAPTDVTSTLLVNQVLLTWTDRNTNETGHRIYRSSSPMDTQAMPLPVDELGPNVTEWEDTDTPVDQVVYYIVSAVRGADEAFSDEVMIDTTPAEEDPYWDNVVALLHFDGVNGSTTFDDDAGRSWTAAGTAQIDTAQAGAFGGASGLFDGAGARITTPGSADFAFGTGDFTIEMRARQVDPTSQWRELFMVNATSGLNIMLFDGKLAIGREGVASDYTVPAPVALGDWYHLAISRAAGVVYGFVNGTLAFSGAYGYNFSQLATVSIGAKSNGVSAFAGHIDELRVTKGVARYTENFTPPTEPFPNVGPSL